MKNLILILSLFGCVTFANAQDLPDFSIIGLEVESDYNANADDAALTAATYILKTSPAEDNESRKRAAQYLLRWMAGTPKYSFEIDNAMTKLTPDNNPDIILVIMAGMTEFVLKNNNDKDNAEKVRLAAVRRLLGYISNSQFKVKQNNELRKALAADKKGQLKEYLAKLAE